MGHRHTKQVLVTGESIDAETINRNRREIVQESGHLDGDNFATGIFDSGALRLSHYADDIALSVAQDTGESAHATSDYVIPEINQAAFNAASASEWVTYATVPVTTGESTLWVIGGMTIGAMDISGAPTHLTPDTRTTGIFGIKVDGRLINDATGFFVDSGHDDSQQTVVCGEAEFFVEVPRGSHVVELVAKRYYIPKDGGVLNPTLIVIEVRS